MSSAIAFSGTEGFNAALNQLKAQASLAVKSAVSKGAHMIEASAKDHASGRPGPNVRSGSHRRSIHVEGPVNIRPYTYQAQIGPSMSYSRRLELGYMDMRDSLGRLFHQPAFPSLKPALDDVTPKLEDVFVEAWGKALELGV